MDVIGQSPAHGFRRQLGAVLVLFRESPENFKDFIGAYMGQSLDHAFPLGQFRGDAAAGESGPASVGLKTAVRDFIMLNLNRHFHGVSAAASKRGLSVRNFDSFEVLGILPSGDDGFGINLSRLFEDLSLHLARKFFDIILVRHVPSSLMKWVTCLGRSPSLQCAGCPVSWETHYYNKISI